MILMEDNKVHMAGSIVDVLAEAAMAMTHAVSAYVEMEKHSRNLTDEEAEELGEDMLTFSFEQVRKRLRDSKFSAAKTHFYAEDGSEVYKKEEGECERSDVPEL